MASQKPPLRGGATYTYSRRKPAQEIETEPMAVYGYARVSRLRQVEEGISLEDQQRRIEGRALELGSPVDRIYVEKGVSASLPLAERPEGKKLLG
jgi:hypothetical protein